MKLGDILGANPLDMTLRMIAGSHGVEIGTEVREKIDNFQTEGKEFFVFIGRLGVDVLEVRERSVMIAQIVGGRMRMGAVIWFRETMSCKPIYDVITMDDWKAGLGKIISGEKRENKLREIAEERELRREISQAQALRKGRKLDRQFDEACEVILYKKMGSRGFNMTFDEQKRRREIEAFDEVVKSTCKRAEIIASVL